MSNGAITSQETKGALEEFYGKTLGTASELGSNAVTSQPLDNLPPVIDAALKMVHKDIREKYYGCGPVYPSALRGMNVLDVGSGCGQDSFIVSKLVGQEGSVLGVDITEELLTLSNSFIDYHMQQFKFTQPNIKFQYGDMENLAASGLKEGQFDLLVSNGVVNLSSDKLKVLSECFRVLKEGGELYFSDVYADRELSCELRANKKLWCECISGVLYWRELYRLAAQVGFAPPRLVDAGVYKVEKEDYKKLVGGANFMSVTYRLFKLPPTPAQPATVTYSGGVEGFEEELSLDHGITFKKGEECHVEADVASILKSSRYNKYFNIVPGQQNGPLKSSIVEKDPFEIIKSS